MSSQAAWDMGAMQPSGAAQSCLWQLLEDLDCGLSQPVPPPIMGVWLVCGKVALKQGIPGWDLQSCACLTGQPKHDTTIRCGGMGTSCLSD